MKKNLLVTLADEKYVEQAKQLFSSAYFNGGWDGDYMLLAHEIPEEKLRWFRKKGILIKKCKPLSYISENKSTIAKLSKFYLFIPEFKKWKNIVFLDADTIVIASIGDLANVKGVYAVKDPFPKIKDQFRRKNNDLELYNELQRDYNDETYAFNSGVLAFNTSIIQKDSFNRLIHLSKKYLKVSHLGEQGILNLFFIGKWRELSRAYNFNPFLLIHPFLTKKDPHIKGLILHFPGVRRPWNSKYSFYYRLWDDNLDKAEKINLKNPINPAIKYPEEEIEKLSKKIERRLFFHSPVNYLDKIVGLIGIFLKKKTPNIYYKIRNFQLNLFKIPGE